MKNNFKNAIITTISILSVFSLTACGNTQTNDKKIATTSGTTTTSAVTTTAPNVENEPVVTTTSAEEMPTDPQVTTAKSDDVVTTTTTTATKSEEVATTSPTVTTTVATSKKPTTTTTTKKNNVTTTTTKKKTTTTTSVKKTTTTTTTKKDNTSSNKNKTQTMWASDGSFLIDYENGYWSYAGDLRLYYGDKVTAYPNDTVTITKNGKKVSYTKIKMIGNAGGTQTISIDGYVGYVETSCLSTKEIKVTKITESDVKKLCAELQEYSNSIFTKQNDYSPKDTEWMVEKENGNGYRWGTYDEYISKQTPSNSSWHIMWGWSIDSQTTYNEMLNDFKETIAYEYTYLPNSHQVLYYELDTDSYTGRDYWAIYLLY